ncbi:MAG: hypothetical protein [Wendovervirus sonii]|uniref:Uncharacterized protein n=1 Tax=phage Lak_Megaphage_Sonny TaxID=3109229 RepID=A0ABZ0Z6C1_9CAUD|nr:MAG: hypothetical protein [phage Lak_Megaphage_Sonny]
MSSCIAHKHLYPIMADMPKECYKIIIVKENGKFFTTHHPTEIGNEYIAGIRPWVASEKGIMKSCIYKGISRWIEGGFIHTYSNINTAIARRDTLAKFGINTKIFKCEIPTNTEYYDCEMNEYMSKQIMFISEIQL